ncbi:MAG: helix-turn-helix domain-containing protein [Pyrinomonadaceae bacterium]
MSETTKAKITETVGSGTAPEDPASGFPDRLRAAFDHASNAEIARRCETSDATIKFYMEGRLPSAELLLRIHRATGINLHWLLTGAGPRRVEGQDDRIFSEEEEQEIREMARIAGRTFEEQTRVLAVAALGLKQAID